VNGSPPVELSVAVGTIVDTPDRVLVVFTNFSIGLTELLNYYIFASLVITPKSLTTLVTNGGIDIVS
jgi:hypothetical protein